MIRKMDFGKMYKKNINHKSVVIRIFFFNSATFNFLAEY